MDIVRINLFANEYHVNLINCVDIPISGAASYYNNDNYYFYNFYYVLFNNWSRHNSNDWLEFRNSILTKIGLLLTNQFVSDRNSFFTQVKENLDVKTPVILILQYKHILYSIDSYKDPSGTVTHAILVTGYNSEKSVFIIRDTILAWNNSEIPYKSDPFYRLQLTEDMVADMWLQSKTGLQDDEYFQNNFFTVRKSDETSNITSNFTELIEDVVNHNYFSDNKLIDFVTTFNSNISDYNNNDKRYFIRKRFYSSLEVVFDCLGKATEELKDLKYNGIFSEIKTRYLNYKDDLTNLLCRSTFREEYIDTSLIIDEIRNMDNDLFKYIQKLNKELSKETRG